MLSIVLNAPLRGFRNTEHSIRKMAMFVNIQEELSQWQVFYQQYLHIACDFSRVKIPERQPGFDRLIVVANGLTLNRVYHACAENFPCRRCVKDLDKAVTHNDRSPQNGSYAVWARDRREADEESRGLSANQLRGQGHKGIILFERALYELKYWDETREHLDQQNATLCSGSRSADGLVPRVGWHDREFRVRWSYPDYARGFLRSRSVVFSVS